MIDNRTPTIRCPGTGQGVASRLIALLLLLAAALGAQTPTNPPPWWGIPDDDTVSLYWDFSAPNFAPTTAIVPAWYVPPSNNGFLLSGSVSVLPTLGGNTDVLGIRGLGSGTVALEVDNDPRPNWIKIFWLQFDGYQTTGTTVGANVRKLLSQYERSIIKEEHEPLANGWVRTTISCQLLPQPDFEFVDFALSSLVGGAAGIDNLFVNSKCIKPPPDQVGKPLGSIAGGSLNTDLNAATGNTDVAAASMTIDRQTNTRRFWVTGRSANGLQHPVYQLGNNGTVISPAVLLQATTATPQNVTDLSVAELAVPGGKQDFVFGILDQRTSAGGVVELLAIDTGVRTTAPTRTITLAGYTGIGPFGLAYSPHGNGGIGSFWISDQTGTIDEVSMSGNILRTLTANSNNLPASTTGVAYDELTGLLYLFSDAPENTPRQQVRVNGYVFDTRTEQPTGQRFYGDLNLPGNGGVAKGLDLKRLTPSGDLLLFCVQRAGGIDYLTTINAPFQFGWNLLGRCGMAGDPPMEGNSNFQITLEGVPNATLALLFAGFSNTTSAGTPLPFNLASAGMPESNISVSIDLLTNLQLIQSGNANYTLPLPPLGSGFSYTPIFFQWLVLDPTLPAGIATSQAGKTVIY